MTDRLPYQERRPSAVPASLNDLAGRTHGQVELPLRPAWSGRRKYDLDVPGDLAVLYERVIVEATDVSDLTALLDQDILVRIWNDLFLPAQVHSRWGSRFQTPSQAA